MNKKTKKVSESYVTMTELVLPQDTNTFNNLMGGRLMHWMDNISTIAAQRHANNVVVTASTDNISFRKVIPLGNVVTLKARVTRAFRSSMEIFIEAEVEDVPNGTKFASNTAYFTFVAIDEAGRPTAVPEAVPETDEEKRLFDGALLRRQLRLVLAGKMDPSEAGELRSLFTLSEE